MRVPISWLKEYVDINESVAEGNERLTNAGLELKTIETIGLPGADLVWDREKIVLGKILKVEQHPNADRLVLGTVDYGAEEPEVVVTGAPNLFQYLGQADISLQNLYSPLALEGAQLFDGHKAERKKMKLKGRPLRGIYNKSMLCSEKELGISEEHEGIIIMQTDADSPDYQVGTPLQDVLGEHVLEIDIIPNIARCASIIGVAREYAALTGQALRYPNYDVKMEGGKVDGRISITTQNPDLNPRFVGILIEGIQQGPAPYWMQHRLRMAGQRPINVAVDISNYVMLEMGQPNHAFDYDFLRGRADEYDPDGPVHIITRLPHEGETLTTLDGLEHKLEAHNILVTDPLSNLSLGGVMGGADSEIKPETQDVLLEAAAWNFINIRRTATRLGIHTDAGFRFSRGVHPSQALLGAKRAAELLRRLAGGTVAEGIIDYYPNPPEALTVKLSPAYARQLSGLDLTPQEMGDLLVRLEFVVEPHGDHLMVTVPDHRMDMEGAHDLVEEICRMYGYGRIPSTILSDSLPPQRGNPDLEKEERVRDILVKEGLQEIISYRLTSAKRESNLGPGLGPDDRPYVTLIDPSTADRNVMRHSVLSSVLEATARNSRFLKRIAIFEIGSVYLPGEDSVLPDELDRLALVMTGQRTNAFWQDDNLQMMDFFDLKGALEGLFSSLHLAVTYEAIEHPTYRPGRTARIMLDKTPLGTIGELHPLVAEAYDVRLAKQQVVLAADIDLEAVLSHIPDSFTFGSLSPYPPVQEDLALVVDMDVAAADVETAVFNAGGFLLKNVELFDVYVGEQIPAGKKSLAYHLTFQSPTKTLKDKDTQKQRKRILGQLSRQIGARLRE